MAADKPSKKKKPSADERKRSEIQDLSDQAAVPVPTPIPDDDDAAIDFGRLPPTEGVSGQLSRSQLSGPLSGTSIVSWAELMKAREEGSATFDFDGPDGIEVDADSDRDILDRVLAADPPSGEIPGIKAAADTDSDDDIAPADPAQPVLGRESMFFDLGAADATSSVFSSPDDRRLPGDSSRVNLLQDLGIEPMTAAELMQKTDQFESPIVFSSPDEDVDIGGMTEINAESSAVDLGSESFVDLPFPLATDSKSPATAPMTSRSRGSRSSSHGSGDSGTVDLLTGGRDGAGLSSIPGLTTVGSSMRPDSGLPTTARYGQRSFAGWLGGGLLGGLTGIAICAGLWLSGAVPDRGASKPIARKAVPTTTLDSAVALMDSGEFDRAFDALGQLTPSPDVKTAIAQNRWLQYLKMKAEDKKKPSATAPEYKEAIFELKQANTATATLWLGLIEESLGKTAAARNIYLEAKATFKDQSKLFQAALDRIDIHTDAPPPQAANPAVGMAVYAILLQAPPATTPDEAGFKFWEAMKFAKAHDYGKAQEALAQAKAAHDARRILVGRKGQNPLSDPMEEIFLRSCDELQAFWKLRNEFHTGGYNLATGYPNASAAFAALATKAAKASMSEPELAKAQAEVKAAREERTAAIDAKKTADDDLKKVKAQLAAMKPATPATDPAEIVTLKADRTKLEGELKLVREQLASMKPAAAGPEGAELAKLKEERTKLEASVKILDEKSKSAEDRLNETVRNNENLKRTVSDLATFARTVRQKLQAPAGAEANEVLTTLDQALAVKPATRGDLPPIPPGAYNLDPRAERAFASGMQNWRSGDAGGAEQSFATAIQLADRDARYWYFLGLAKLAQGRTSEAEADFQQGVDRERRNLPNPGVVDASLERLPGNARAAVNRVRGR